jgi:hypothetical protein
VVTINAVPTANISYGNDSLCDIGSVDVPRRAARRNPYSISKKGLIIDQLTGRIDLDKVQREDVTYSFSNGKCTSTATTVVKIDNCKIINLFNVIAPNPANYQFTLVLEDGSNEK